MPKSSRHPNRYQLLSPELVDHLESLPEEDQSRWLILSPHEDFKGRWAVDGLAPQFFWDFEEMIGTYRTVAPANLGEFLDAAEVMDYSVVFEEDPTAILDTFARLEEPPPFSLNSTMDGTIQGFFPWQIRGFNKLVRYDEGLKGAIALWDTGLGKTVLMAMALKWYAMQDAYDLALVVVKSNNKRDTHKKLKSLLDIDSIVLDAYKPDKRFDLYLQIEEALSTGRVNAITNYEKFREDREFFQEVVSDRRVLVFWDEMPTKLKNRGTELYQSVRKCFYGGGKMLKWSQRRPSWLKQFELTATPIERNPEDQFSCIRLLDPELWPTVTQWEAEHVASKNYFSKKPERFHKLDKMSLTVDFMTHHVSKDDPEVRQYFPEVLHSEQTIDWAPQQRKLYDTLTGKAADMLDSGAFDEDNILALIGAMQMICDLPSMVLASAENRRISEAAWEKFVDETGDFDNAPSLSGSEIAMRLVEGYRGKITDEGHTKLDTLRELLLDKHPGEKGLVFMTWGDMGLPVLSDWLTHWGVSHIVYAGTQKQKDDLKDHWRSTPDCRIFLSSDSGSDGIDLPEATFMVNYNLPWKYSTKRQRHRHDRPTSLFDLIYVYDLLMDDSVEERRKQIVAKKQAYDQDFKGEIVTTAVSQRMTKDELLYMLTGR